MFETFQVYYPYTKLYHQLISLYTKTLFWIFQVYVYMSSKLPYNWIWGKRKKKVAARVGQGRVTSKSNISATEYEIEIKLSVLKSVKQGNTIFNLKESKTITKQGCLTMYSAILTTSFYDMKQKIQIKQFISKISEEIALILY